MKIIRLEELSKLRQENMLLRKELKTQKSEIRSLTRENKLLRRKLKLTDVSIRP